MSPRKKEKPALNQPLQSKQSSGYHRSPSPIGSDTLGRSLSDCLSPYTHVTPKAPFCSAPAH
ncbi:hypothetical protein J6590_019261 [Homalodisca vitripennis]|nr:hypothetical protein J6590_019261 [Homalodisca vitripennis]